MADLGRSERLRQELADCRQGKGFNRYPSELRNRAAAYALRRRKSGVGPSVIAKELGVAITTADAWSKHEAAPSLGADEWGADKLSLVPVVVRPESPRRILSRLEVDFADGTKLQATGIEAEDLVRALELLRRRA